MVLTNNLVPVVPTVVPEVTEQYVLQYIPYGTIFSFRLFFNEAYFIPRGEIIN